MPYDGLTAHAIALEMDSELRGKKIQKIFQPGKSDIRIYYGQKRHILLSANPQTARVALSAESDQNPQVAPGFCMALRKHLLGATITGIEQSSFDRVLAIHMESLSAALGLEKYSLITEIMGKHSNIILVRDSDRSIVDAVKRVPAKMSSVRQVLPGLEYKLPPVNKLSPLDFDIGEACDRMSFYFGMSRDRALSEVFMGLSRQLARTVSEGAGPAISPEEFMAHVQSFFANIDIKPYVYYEGANIKDFSAVLYTLGSRGERRDSISAAVEDRFISAAAKAPSPASVYSNESKKLKSSLARAQGKLAARISELEQAKGSELLAQKANLLLSYPNCAVKGDKAALVPNIFSEEMEDVEIELSEQLSVAENAQRYFKLYRKAKNASIVLSGLIAEAEDEAFFLSSAIYHLSTAPDRQAAIEILELAAEKGYLAKKKSQQKSRQPSNASPIEYKGSLGASILVGRNDRQNDALTNRSASKDDIWLHAKGIAGSHVVLKTKKGGYNDEELLQAASAAAWHSAARESDSVEVDYTYVRNVKKPNGAPAGKVIYTNQRTLYVSPAIPG
ncbi:MAG: NFACT family protein [Eubacteriaceae bacterium]|nr:NFACT family protein [Eubacteriaceae bacterium]